MKSAKPGGSTSVVEVTHISSHGFWLLLPSGEIFVPFASFPWFRDATIAELQAVQLLHSDHLFWPKLDVDLAVESIEQPERFPLVSRVRTKKALKQSAGAGTVSDKAVPRRRAARR